jgi:hypothetical protein
MTRQRAPYGATCLEIERPVRTVVTWVFEGRPDDEAVEMVELHEEDRVTTMTILLAFKDQANRGDWTAWSASMACKRQKMVRGATTESRTCSPHSHSRGWLPH